MSLFLYDKLVEKILQFNLVINRYNPALKLYYSLSITFQRFQSVITLSINILKKPSNDITLRKYIMHSNMTNYAHSFL